MNIEEVNIADELSRSIGFIERLREVDYKGYLSFESLPCSRADVSGRPGYPVREGADRIAVRRAGGP